MNHRDAISNLLIRGMPAAPSSRATKDELKKEIKRYRRLLSVLRDELLASVISQIRGGLNDGVTPTMLRELADQLEREQDG